MQTSDRGSAVVEFLVLIFPMSLLVASTVGVAWFSFAKSQLNQVASEAAFQAAEADSTEVEVDAFVEHRIEKIFPGLPSVSSSDRQGGLVFETITVAPFSFFDWFDLSSPEITAEAVAPVEA